MKKIVLYLSIGILHILNMPYIISSSSCSNPQIGDLTNAPSSNDNYVLSYELCSLTQMGKGNYLSAAQNYENFANQSAGQLQADLYLQAAIARLVGAGITMLPQIATPPNYPLSLTAITSAPASVIISQASMFSNALQDYDTAFMQYITAYQKANRSSAIKIRAKNVLLQQFLIPLQTFINNEYTGILYGPLNKQTDLTGWAWQPLSADATAVFSMQNQYNKYINNVVNLPGSSANYFKIRDAFMYHPLDFMSVQDAKALIALQPYSVGQKILNETPQGLITSASGMYQNFNNDQLINALLQSSIKDPNDASQLLAVTFKQCLQAADIYLMEAYAQLQYVQNTAVANFPSDVLVALQAGFAARTNALKFYDTAILKLCTALSSSSAVSASSFTKLSAATATIVLSRALQVLQQIYNSVLPLLAAELGIFDVL